MKIKIQQFLYQNHSWSVVGWNIARALIKQGHEVHLIPTDRDKKCHLPEDLKPYEKTAPIDKYDCQISYTAPLNWGNYLKHGNKNRFAIWAYEFNGKNVLSPGFVKYHQFTDKVLPPSEFCKDVFKNSGMPDDKLVVVPHGINLEDYNNKNKFPLQNKKKIKIGLPLGQLHRRKNLSGLLEAYLKAFKKTDDVCLVLKTQTQKQQEKSKLHLFDVDFNTVLHETKLSHKNGGAIEVVTKFIPDMIEFYNTCDIIFTMSNAEGFYMPGLEALAAGKLVVAPRYGGQLDFLNDDNAVLIDGKTVRVPRKYTYWSHSQFAEMFKPDVDDAAKKIKYAVDNYDELLNKLSPNMKAMSEKLTWANVASQIIGLCK